MAVRKKPAAPAFTVVGVPVMPVSSIDRSVSSAEVVSPS